MTGSFHDLEIRIVGPLTVVAADGSVRTPRSQKARALLALLAFAPDGRRTRTWLQDKLWSARGPEQAAASLRQVLSDIRRAFGDLRDCLVSDRQMVALDVKRVVVCRQRTHVGAHSGTDDAVLLEGLDVPDNEFEAWLSHQRGKFEDEAEVASDATEKPVEPAGDDDDDGSRLRLVIGLRANPAGPRERLVADGLTDIVARSVAELSHVEVVDERMLGPAELRNVRRFARNSLIIHADVAEDAAGVTCRLSLTSPRDGRLVWSTGVRTTDGIAGAQEPAVLRDLNQIVEEVYRHFLSMPEGACGQRAAALLCRQGIQRLLRMKKDELLAADRLFQQAFEIEPRGVYLAWRAYLRTFLIVEFLPKDRDAIADEALALMHKSIELEPNNSYVAAFAAHVQSIVRQSYVFAFELAERSVQLNPANAIGWGCLGIAECYLGKPGVGFQHTLHARELSGATPFRFFVTGQAAIAGSMAGDVHGATFLAEAAHGLAPAFKPPMRFLSALYLLSDRQEASHQMVEKVRVTEPNFSYELLRDTSYPASSLHRSRLLEKIPQRQI